MNKFEHRFIIKYFHLKGWGNRRITAELESTFQGSALPRATVKRWLRKFKSGDLSCLDENRPDRPLTILERVLKKFLDKYSFASAKALSRHFDISPPTVKKILHRELGLKKYSRKWVPHELSEDQKSAESINQRCFLAWFSCMPSIISRELRRATNNVSFIRHTEIQCLRLQRGRWCRGPSRLFLASKLWLQFSSHRLDCSC
jgi:hypothetical protein